MNNKYVYNTWNTLFKGPEEAMLRFPVAKYRSKIVKDLWKITEEYNTLHPTNWTDEVTQIMKDYQSFVVKVRIHQIVSPISNSESTNFSTGKLRKTCFGPIRSFLSPAKTEKNSWNKLVKTSDEFVKRDELDLPVTKQDFLEAISKCNKSVSKEDLEKYEKWMEEFGSS